MMDHKSPVGQDNYPNTADGQGADPELNKSPTISLSKSNGAIPGIGENLLSIWSQVAAPYQCPLQLRLTALVMARNSFYLMDSVCGKGLIC